MGKEEHGHTSCVESHLCGVEIRLFQARSFSDSCGRFISHPWRAATQRTLHLPGLSLPSCRSIAGQTMPSRWCSRLARFQMAENPLGPHQALHIPGAGQALIYLPPTVNWGGFNRRICEIMITRLALYFFVCKIMGFGLNWGRCADVLVKSVQPLSP